nr:pyridoxal-phosphate dependent enzyme [Planosporangium thailandense]
MHEVIGRTPLVRLRTGAPAGVEVYAKLELQNPFAMKDRVARNVILQARQSGALQPGAPIVESSSGTMALGVALVGRALGHPVHIVTDPRIDRITMAKLRALGCELVVVPAMTTHGWQSARLEALAELLRALPGAFWPQQYSNPDNPGAYRDLADELLADLDRVDVLVGSVGSGGSLCGTARALRRRLPNLWVVGVDCVGSVLFDQPDMPQRLQSGLGNSLLPKNLDRRLIDEVHWLNDREAFAATRDLAAEQQIFAGNTSGSVYRVLADVARRARPGDRIVGIFPDRGDRYAETVHDPQYWARQRLDDLPLAARPEEVQPGTPVLSWSRTVTKGVVDGPRHLLFVEANTSGTGMLALSATARLDLRPVLLTGAPERYPDLSATGAEVLRCDSNAVPALWAAIQERFRREEIAGITTTSDFYVPVVAELAARLGLPGNPTHAVQTCRNKATLRSTLAAAGIHQPRFAVVSAPAEAAAAVHRVGLPCVVKPVDDSGSTNVRLCATVEEAVTQVTRILAVRTNVRGLPTAGMALVEEYLDGPEFSVEMFSMPGHAMCVGITAKQVTGAPHFVESRHVFPAGLPAADADRITETVRRTLQVCGIELGPTHTEIKLTADGPAVIEVNPRLAGGMIPELIRSVTGLDLLEQQLRLAAHLPVLLAAEPAGHAGIQFLLADSSGILTGFEGVEAARALPGVQRVTPTARFGVQVGPPSDAYGRLGHVIARADTIAEVHATLDAATRLIRMALARSDPE